MNRRVVLVTGIVLIVLGIGGYFLSTRLAGAKAGILIETNPPATVYLNDDQVGTSPYDATQDSGEVTVRLVPISTDKVLSPWQTKLTLTSGIKTVVKRDFAEIDAQSAGEVLSFEKISGRTASLTIVSSPDSSQVTIDGDVKGFTPLPLDSLPPGDHRIVVSQPGFLERTIAARTYEGHKLTVVAMLAQIPGKPLDELDLPEATQEGTVQTQVEILDTPTGFLRVRAAPSTSATESAQVKPGETYDLLEENSGGTWYKIEYKAGREGWISSQYAKKKE